jgi:hypothetical protein
MSPVLAERQLALLAAALAAVVVGLAIAGRHRTVLVNPPGSPRPAASDISGWYTALAAVRTRPLAGHASGCGTLLDPRTLGVDHPVLPCGAKIFLRYGKKTVLTTVVDRGPLAPGAEFEVTPALADVLGLSGVQSIRWSFARAGTS